MLIEGIFPGHVAAIERELSVLGAREQEELGRLCRKLGLQGEPEGDRRRVAPAVRRRQR